MYGKNTQSLQSEERLHELLEEAEEITWDVIFVAESWRGKKEEDFVVKQGHLFLGAGGTPGERGTALLIHKRWKSGLVDFRARSERLAAADVDLDGIKYTLVSVYFPHAGYSDRDVEKVYELLSQERAHALKKGRRFIVAGDWNAVVGGRRGGGNEEHDWRARAWRAQRSGRHVREVGYIGKSGDYRNYV